MIVLNTKGSIRSWQSLDLRLPQATAYTSAAGENLAKNTNHKQLNNLPQWSTVKCSCVEERGGSSTSVATSGFSRPRLVCRLTSTSTIV